MQILATAGELDFGARLWGMPLIVLLSTGGVVGWLVHLVEATPGRRLVSDVLLGITGALIAKSVFMVFGNNETGGLLDGLLPAVMGALTILFVAELFTSDRT